MIHLIWIIFFVLLCLFSFAVFFGAPYVPTLNSQQTIALELLKLKPGQVFYDLGCGDGRLLRAAARTGVTAVGYEINPLLVVIAWLRTRNTKGQVRIIWGNFWRADLGDADGIFVFLVERHMLRLNKYLKNQAKDHHFKVVSFGFKIPKAKRLASRGAVFLYQY